MEAPLTEMLRPVGWLTEAQTERFNAQLEALQAQVAIRVARARVAYVAGD